MNEIHITDEYIRSSREAANEVAEAKNCDVIEGTSNTLLLDFDGTFDNFESRKRIYDTVDETFIIDKVETWPSSSGEPGHIHCVITVKARLTQAERVALQAALGSDPMREVLAVKRMWRDYEGEPSLLFKPRT